MASQRFVPRKSCCCRPAGSEFQFSLKRFNAFCSSADSEDQATGADVSAAGGASACARPAPARCTPAAKRAVSAARRVKRKSLTSAFLLGRLRVLDWKFVDVRPGEKI